MRFILKHSQRFSSSALYIGAIMRVTSDKWWLSSFLFIFLLPLLVSVLVVSRRAMRTNLLCTYISVEGICNINECPNSYIIKYSKDKITSLSSRSRYRECAGLFFRQSFVLWSSHKLLTKEFKTHSYAVFHSDCIFRDKFSQVY